MTTYLRHHRSLVLARLHLAVLHGSFQTLQTRLPVDPDDDGRLFDGLDDSERLADQLMRFGSKYDQRKITNMPSLQSAWRRASEALQLSAMFEKLGRESAWLDEIANRSARRRIQLALFLLAAAEFVIVINEIGRAWRNDKGIELSLGVAAMLFFVTLGVLLFRKR